MTRTLLVSSITLALATISQNSLAGTSSANNTTTRTAEYTAANTDTSNDLTLAEYKAYISGLISSQYTTLDTDGTSGISLTEFIGTRTGNQANMATELFNLADTDASNSLGVDEFAVISPGGSTGDTIRMFAGMDQNFDLLVSQDEYVNGGKHGKGGKGGKGAPQFY